jgi:hypothetical protein
LELGTQEGMKLADVEGGALKIVFVEGIGMAVVKVGQPVKAQEQTMNQAWKGGDGELTEEQEPELADVNTDSALQPKPKADEPEPDESSAMNDAVAYRICRGDDLADAVLKGNLKWAKKLAKELRELLEAEAEEGGWRPSLDTFFIPVSDAEDLAQAWKHVFGEVDQHERWEKIAAFFTLLDPEYRRDIQGAAVHRID